MWTDTADQVLGKDGLMEEKGFQKPFLSLLPPGKTEQSFHAARFPGLLSQSLINHGDLLLLHVTPPPYPLQYSA